MTVDTAKLRVIQPAELAQHASPESCWVVIRGLVYDVTRFHHPGGNDRLFELAGRDATRFFERISHSAAAHRHLGNLLVGKLAAASEEQAPTPPAAPPVNAPVTGQRPLKGGTVHREAREGEALWSTRCRGFLPVRDPVSVGEPYAVLQRLVAALPVALADGTFRELVEAEAATSRRSSRLSWRSRTRTCWSGCMGCSATWVAATFTALPRPTARTACPSFCRTAGCV